MRPLFPHAVDVSDMPLETPLPRCTLRGSLDPTTGIFYRAPERARIRTAQACDKCRVRKAKCSGDHPVCERCRIRGLTCQYAPERRPRRWSGATAAGGEADKGNGRPVSDPSPGLQPRPVATSIAHGLPSPSVDVEHPGNSQPTKNTPPSRPDTTEPSVASEEEDEGGTSDNLDTPHIEDDTLAVCFEPYANDPLAFLEAILTLEATGDVDLDLTGVEHHEGVDGTQYPPSFHPPSSHRPGLCFDVFSVDPAIQPKDAESPVQTPSMTPSASPVLPRTSSDGLPMTPTNSPFMLASFSPHLGPYANGPRPYSLLASEVQTMEMDTAEYMSWGEAKDGVRTFGENGALFLDLDTVF